MKKCGRCLETKPLDAFHTSKRWGIQSYCKDCNRKQNKEYYQANKTERNARSSAWYKANPERAREYAKKYYAHCPEQRMLNAARHRAKVKGVPCTIVREDILIPDVCPLLGIKLQHNSKGYASPSLDRIDPSKGYVPGNVWVISDRANTIKSNATPDELIAIGNGLLARTSLLGV
jgi:hypothetical protein